MNKDSNTDFCIVIDFKKDSENPTRIFQTMTELINSFQEFDSSILKGIDTKLEPVLILEDIERGSLKTILSNKLKGIPDEVLKSGDWKQVLGHYLVKAKFILINNLEGKTHITDGELINNIQKELVEEAENTDVKLFPHYHPIPIPHLISTIDKVNKSLKHLNCDDKAVISSESGVATFNLELDFTATEIEDLLTKEEIANESIMILKVKKPDYLGTSMWDFKFGEKSISAKIIHESWLVKFQHRKIDIRPGDSIKAKVNIIVKYGHDNSLIGQTYEILEVIEILPLNPLTQTAMEV